MRPWQAGRESGAVYAGSKWRVCHRWFDGRARKAFESSTPGEGAAKCLACVQ
jgi:hypothetical protein